MTQNYIERYWRDATPGDAIKEPPMVARFTYYPDGFPGNFETVIDVLRGVIQYKLDRNTDWFDSKGNRYGRAQVYDAPDPGEGWRLIDTENEQPQDGDEFLGKDDVWIRKLSESNTGFSDEFIYRRRITPAVTYVPFTWEDREQLRGRWYRVTLSYGEIRECQIEFFRLDRGVFFVGSFPSEQLLEKGAIFLDTGKPVGKEVVK